jgi:hypothetical protein
MARTKTYIKECQSPTTVSTIYIYIYICVCVPGYLDTTWANQNPSQRSSDLTHSSNQGQERATVTNVVNLCDIIYIYIYIIDP